MKAIVYRTYGSPDVLKCEEVEKPAPADDEVLIKVRAASTNPLDWHFMRGLPYAVRLAAKLDKTKGGRLGVDVSGTVETVGKNVTQFKPGDTVFGSCKGAFAEYVCTPQSMLTLKPGNITFEHAAAVPVAAYSALQALRDHGQIQPGYKVLVNGASGGVGTFGVQIAKSFGAEVTGVCSTRNLELVRSIGADHVIDYMQEDFTKPKGQYDIFLDCIANHPFSTRRRVLKPKGVYLPVGGTTDPWLIGPIASLIRTVVVSLFVSQKLVKFFLANPNQKDLSVMAGLMQSGKVTPVIDRCYQLAETAEAIRYLETGHARGKVVITVAPNQQM